MTGRPAFVATLCIAALVCAAQAAAAPRGIRIEFGEEWGSDDEGAIGSPACPGTTAGSVLVAWNGHEFSGQSDPQFGFTADTYCQQTVAFNPGDPFATYFFSGSFAPDESVLGSMVGANRFGQVSGIRYTFLGGPRFQNPNGFQWVFYSFPRQVTVVGLYGLTAIPLSNTYSYIDGPDGRVWSGGSDGYDGQYFCFRGEPGPFGTEHRFIGTWNGSLSPGNNACLQEIATQHRDGFED